MIVLGISCFYHDSAACIIKDGIIRAAVAEERFTRIKHDNNFPKFAIEYCLNELGIAINEIDVVVFYEKPIWKFERILNQHIENFPKSARTFVNSMGAWLHQKRHLKRLLQQEYRYHGKVWYIPHHLAHAASSYYLSGFNKAVIVTVDGVGEWATTTVGVGTNGKIRIDQEIRFPHSLGLLYSTITAFLGFEVNSDEYKVMGLSAYGDPKRFMKMFDELVEVFDDGSYRLNMRYFDFNWAEHMPSQKMCELFGKPMRKTGDPIRRYHENIAASLQKKLESVMFNLLEKITQADTSKNLCLAGGVALNSVLNAKILKNSSFTQLYIPPDPGDAGGAMGAALYGATVLKERLHTTSFYPNLGPEFNSQQMLAALIKRPVQFTLVKNRDKLLDAVVDLLVKKKIVGWFQGRMEWGPRALGNRSILAGAEEEQMRDIINEKVKLREMFRPFAPVILEEYVNEYFEADKPVPEAVKYMLFVYPFKKEVKKKVAATVHVDGTGRLQSISRQDNPLYYDLIERYRQKTGIPVVVNTSFNVKGEPIVCTPGNALDCFLGTDIDYLVMGNYLVSKMGGYV